jgi:flavin-dependent dehydrogenase
MRRAPPLIVGGGIAGAAAAIRLARARLAPLLVERSAGPHDKVCGEFLSVETVAGLRALGVDPEALGAAPIASVRLARGERLAEARLPFRALSLSRRRLDEALLAQAARAGAAIERGRWVRALAELPSGPVLAATGKHGLRGVPRPPGAGLVGLKGYFRLAPAQARSLAGAVELVAFPGGYAGLQLVEDGIANLCLLAPAGPGADLLAVAMGAPHLARRLEGAGALLARPLAIANLPYGWTHRPAPGDPTHMYRLGDQWGMIPSFTGDGMALALATAALAARALGEGAPAAAYHAAANRRLRPALRRAHWLARAGLSPLVGPLVPALARAWPGLMALAARATRAPAFAA